MKSLRTIVAALFALAPLSAAWSQAVPLLAEPWTTNHAPMFLGSGQQGSQPIITDSGPAGGGGNGLGMSEGLYVAQGMGAPPYVATGTGPYGTNWCDYDGPITSAGGYHYLCLSANAQGGGLLAIGAGGLATPQPFNIIVNGVTYPFPGSGGGSGTVSSGTANDLAYYATTGTTVSPLASANNGALITSNTGVPSISSTLPSAVQGNITATGALASGSLASGFTVVGGALGGTGVNNGSNTLTLGDPLVTTGSGTTTLAFGSSATYTFPSASATMAFTSGALTNNHCAEFNGSGAIVDSGAGCGGGSGSGTVSSATPGQLAIYTGSNPSTTVAGLANVVNSVAATNGGGTVAWASTLPSAVQGNITATGALASGSLASGFTVVGGALGGTGVNNGSNTITVAGNLTTTGAGPTTLAFPGSTATFTTPASTDTLAGLGTTQTFSATDTFSGTLNCTGTCEVTVSATQYPMAYTNGTLTNGHCVSINAAGALVDAGGACTTGMGSGTVASATSGQIAVYTGSSPSTTVGGVTAANNAAFVTNGSGVASWGTALPSQVQGNIIATGTVASGTWNGSVVAGQYGGTGVANTGKTITLGANLTTTGAGAATLAFPGSSATFTLPGATATLAGLGTTQTFSGVDTFSGTWNCTATCELNSVPFGTAATVNTGTSGATIPLLNANNTYSGTSTFTGNVSLKQLINNYFYAAGYGMKCDGSTNDVAAFNSFAAAVTTSGGIGLIGGGTCVMPSTPSSIVVPSGGTRIVGAGQGVTVLKFTGGTDGLDINNAQNVSTTSGGLSLADFSLITTQAGTGACIKITGTPIGTGAGMTGSLNGVAQTIIDRMSCTSDGTSGHYWSQGLYLDCSTSSQVSNYKFEGDRGAALTALSGTAIYYICNRGATYGLTVNNAEVSVAAFAIDVENSVSSISGAPYVGVQGVNIVNSNFFAVDVGIKWLQSTLQPGLYFTNSNIESYDTAMLLESLNTGNISNSTFEAHNTNSAAGINCTGCLQIVINDNVMTCAEVHGCNLIIGGVNANQDFSQNNIHDNILLQPSIGIDVGCATSCGGGVAQSNNIHSNTIYSASAEAILLNQVTGSSTTGLQNKVYANHCPSTTTCVTDNSNQGSGGSSGNQLGAAAINNN